MPRDLQGKVAIVVGASSGMGRATTALLAQSGMQVVAAARREDRLVALHSELAEAGVTIETRTTDSTDVQQVQELIDSTVERIGPIDVLVYATGTNIPQRAIEAHSSEDWDMMIATNLSGAFHCTKAVVPVMQTHGGGLIIYLSSAAVQMPDVSGVAYQSSKHALTGLAHGTRIEEKQHGIRTTVIYPGLCDTEILTKRPTPTPREILDLSLDPQDVAEAVHFVASLDERAVVPEMQLLPSRI